MSASGATVERRLFNEFAARMDRVLPRGARVSVGFSGGIDSVVLLDLFWRMSRTFAAPASDGPTAADLPAGFQTRPSPAERLQTERFQTERLQTERLQTERFQTERFQAAPFQAARFQAGRILLQAIHVHHGLSPNADCWAQFCKRFARRRGIPLQVHRVDVERGGGLGLEAAAREARYRAFAQSDAEYIALAHHADDQAETFLIQLLRGAGPAGLGGMPESRTLEPAAGTAPGAALRCILRPLLDVRRADIAAYAASRRLRWMNDESNDDTTFLRNAIRHEILPRLERWNAGAVDNLRRGARLIAEAGEIVRDVAACDLASCRDGESLRLSRLLILSPARAINALRGYLESQGLRPLSFARTRELWLQITAGRTDAQMRFDIEHLVVRRYRDAIFCEPASAAAAAVDCPWDGSNPWRLDHLGGRVLFHPACGAGIDARLLTGAHQVDVRPRQQSQTFKPVGSQRRRTLKNLFQEAAIPGWRRDRLPYVYIDGALVWVPGLGVAADLAASSGDPGVQPEWLPDGAATPARASVRGGES